MILTQQFEIPPGLGQIFAKVIKKETREGIP